jgi:hypothetical protein
VSGGRRGRSVRVLALGGLVGIALLGSGGRAVALGAATVPLVPSRDEARGWAVRELADPAYARAQPGLLERAVRWVLDRLAALRLRADVLPDARTGVVLAVLLLALVAALVLLRTGRLRGAGRAPGPATVFAGATRSAAAYRQLADEAAARGDWTGAVRERFRAVVRGLEERTVLDERPGRTADEAAAEAGRALPGQAADLTVAARLFDEVTYGGRPAGPEHDAPLRSLDAAVAAARPAWGSTGAAVRDWGEDPRADLDGEPPTRPSHGPARPLGGPR